MNQVLYSQESFFSSTSCIFSIPQLVQKLANLPEFANPDLMDRGIRFIRFRGW